MSASFSPTETMSPNLPPIAEVLPHRDTMLLLDAVLSWDAESTMVTASVDARAWYADAQGAMPSWIGIELMAQAIAAHVGLVARAAGKPPKQGVLLGTRAYRATMPRFPAGARLTVMANPVFRDDSGMGAYDCRIVLADQTVATATIKVFEPEDFSVFLAQNQT